MNDVRPHGGGDGACSPENQKISITSVLIEKIHHRSDARHRDDEALAQLAESINSVGLIAPIRVRRVGHGYEVVAGSHRLQAVDSLGWREVPCVVTTDDDIAAELAMIAENLHRAELSVLERDDQVARWIELTNQQPPKKERFEHFYSAVSGGEDSASKFEPPKPHVGRPERRNFDASQVETHRKAGQQPGGINAAARDLGISKPDAHRAVKVASLSDEAKAVARNVGLDNNRTALLEAAKHTSPQAQVKALHDRKQGGSVVRIDEKLVPTYEQMRAAILLLARLTVADMNCICPPNKRAAMCQKLTHLIGVFEQVKEGASQ